MSTPDKNKRVMLILLLCIGAMTGLAFASVPFYRMFCSATGLGGTTQRVSIVTNGADPAQESARPVDPPKPVGRIITVTFDGYVDKDLPWEFAPDARTVQVKVGEVTNITYHAINHGNHTMVGTATFNVQPDKAGSYFDKIQCFCFEKEVLKPGERVSLPVQFYIDPEIIKDHHADDVQNITLSYTFFLAKDQSKAQNNPKPTKP